jgi:serine/threonine-protein kinase
VIERSTAKEPKRRYPDMASMLADLEGALEVEVARGGTDGQATNVLDAVPGRRRLLPPRRASAAGVLLVLAAVAAALLIAALTGSDESSSGGGAPQGAAIELAAAQSFDPLGDGEEHDSEAGFAIDANPDTTWTTESYQVSPVIEDSVSGKKGVGLVVDAGRPVAGRNLTIRSDAGGWKMEVYRAASGPPTSLDGWGSPIGGENDMNTDQTVEFTSTNAGRYYLIWITEVASTDSGNNVAIGDVRLST